MKKKIFIIAFVIIALLFMGGTVKADETINDLLFNVIGDFNYPDYISGELPPTNFVIDSEDSSYVTDYSFDIYDKVDDRYVKLESEFEAGKIYYLRGEITLSDNVTMSDDAYITYSKEECGDISYNIRELKEQSQVTIEGQTYKFNIYIDMSNFIDVLEIDIERPTEGPRDYYIDDLIHMEGFADGGYIYVYDEESEGYNHADYLEYGDKYRLDISIASYDYFLGKNSKIKLWGNLYDIYFNDRYDEYWTKLNEIVANGGIVAHAGNDEEYNQRLNITVVDTLVKEYNINITVDNPEQGTVTGSNLMYVKNEEDRTLTITPNAGYMIDKVLINNIDKTADVVDNQLTILNITEDKEVKVFFKKIPYTLTINNTEGATITPNGVIIVESGDNQEITIIAESGYILKSVKVNGVEKLSTLTDNKLELTNITEDTEVTVVVEEIIYEILEGKDLKTSDLSKLRFRIDADYSKFSTGGKVFVDDVELTNEQYTSKSGSTIIELAESFASTLSEGNHKIKVVFNDGVEVATNFTIESANVPSEQDEKQDDKQSEKKEGKGIANPKTGDRIVIYSVVGIVALLGVIIFIVVSKRKENKIKKQEDK